MTSATQCNPNQHIQCFTLSPSQRRLRACHPVRCASCSQHATPQRVAQPLPGLPGPSRVTVAPPCAAGGDVQASCPTRKTAKKAPQARHGTRAHTWGAFSCPRRQAAEQTGGHKEAQGGAYAAPRWPSICRNRCCCRRSVQGRRGRGIWQPTTATTAQTHCHASAGHGRCRLAATRQRLHVAD